MSNRLPTRLAPANSPLLERWLKSRQTLIVELVELSSVARQANGATHRLSTRLRSFCSLLVDYVSAGHFEFYTRFPRGTAADRELQRLYYMLQKTTDCALKFNQQLHRFEQNGAALVQELAVLSVDLEDRFTCEDRLILATRKEARGEEGTAAGRRSAA